MISQQSQSNPPCTQSVEFGWDVDTSLSQYPYPEFFVFGTNNGYLNYSYNGEDLSYGCYVCPNGGTCTTGSCQANGTCSGGGSCSAGGSCTDTCPIWIENPYHATMTAGMTLPYSVVDSGTSQYQLATLAQWEGGGQAGWWLQTGVYQVSGTELAGYGTSGLAFQGYFEGTTYSGPMASGQAQTIQSGGEVFQSGESDAGTWSVPMGSGKDPSGGYKMAAYVYGTEGCVPISDGGINYTDAAGGYWMGECTSPSLAPTVGPVTIPASYSYSLVTPGPPGYPGWGDNYFYLGGPNAVDKYWWTQVTFGTGQPSVDAPSLPIAAGANEITMAPVYVFDSSLKEAVLDIYVLSSNSSANKPVKKYNWLTNSWSNVLNSGGTQVNAIGLATDDSSTSGTYNDAPYWSWTYSTRSQTTWGAIWTGDADAGIVNDSSGTVPWNKQTATSVAVASTGNILVTSNLATCTDLSGLRSLPCIRQFSGSGAFPAGSWIQGNGYGYGANQVVVDQITSTFYALDGAAATYGNVWSLAFGLTPWVALNTYKCANHSQNQSFALIAAKGGVVYGLGTQGTVWAYNAALGANCWSPVGSKTNWAVSIATDNGDTVGVWASDTSGNIWNAD